jgi:hypothetical protein
MKTNKTMLLTAFFGLFILIGSSCVTNRNNPHLNDLTPPEMIWVITNHGTGQSTRMVGNKEFEVERNVKYTVFFCPKDDGGLKEITKCSTSGKVCQCGETGQVSGPSLCVLETISLELDEQGRALTKYCTNFSDLMLQGQCHGDDCTVYQYTTLNVTAKNHSDIVANGSLSLIFRIE